MPAKQKASFHQTAQDRLFAADVFERTTQAMNQGKISAILVAQLGAALGRLAATDATEDSSVETFTQFTRAFWHNSRR